MATQSSLQPRPTSLRSALTLGAVVLGLLALSLVAGYATGSGRGNLALLIAGGPLALLALLFMIRQFDLAVMALPVAALAVPLEIPTGTETRLPAALLLSLGLWGIWLLSMIVRGKSTVAPSPLNRPSLIFSAICCISLVWGILWRDPVLIVSSKFIIVQVAALLTILVSMGAAVLVGTFMQTTARLKFMVGAFICCGLLMTITQMFGIRQGFLNDRGLWGMWTVLPAYTLVICRSSLRWYWRALLVVVILLTLYQTAVVNADWVSGWVPTIVALFAATFLRSKKAFLVLVVIGVIGGLAVRGFFEEVAQDNIDDGSLERLSLWEQNWRVVREHWLFGTGPAGYAAYYMTYYRDDARSTHNNYLDILAQFGFSGMITWLWVAITGVVEGWRLCYRAPPGFLRALAIAATAGWIGAQFSMFFGDWVLPFAYNQGVGGFKYTVYSWLFLGALISIRRMISAPASLSAQPAAEL